MSKIYLNNFIKIYLFCLFITFYFTLQVNSTNKKIGNICACIVKKGVEHKRIDNASKCSSTDKLIENEFNNSDCEIIKENKTKFSKIKNLRKKFGRSKSTETGIKINEEKSKKEKENKNTTLVNFKKEIQKIREDLNSEIKINSSEKNEENLNERKRAKSLNDFYPSHEISEINAEEDLILKNNVKWDYDYYGEDKVEKASKMRKTEFEKRRNKLKKISSRTNSASTSNSNTKTSSCLNTEEDRGDCSKNNEINEEITQILENAHKIDGNQINHNFSKLSFEIESIPDENLEEQSSSHNEKKSQYITDLELDKSFDIQNQKIPTKSNKQKFLKKHDWKKIMSKSFSTVKKSKESNEKQSFSETNLKSKYSEEFEDNKQSNEEMSSLTEFNILFPETLYPYTPPPTKSKNKLSLLKSAVRKSLLRQKSKESQNSNESENIKKNIHIKPFDSESLYFTPTTTLEENSENNIDENDEEK